MSGLPTKLPLKIRANPLFLLLLVTASAISASSPPSTLPRGFLEKLPMFLDMPDKEYKMLLQSGNKKRHEQSRQHNKRSTEKPQ